MKLSAIALIALALAILPGPSRALPQQPSPAAKAESSTTVPDKMPWWKKAVFYEIYPRSFADAKNSGMGNLSGITSRLDYLKDLGVDAIWITPCYPSPQVDFGYDISDYVNISPEYGTLADFDKLIAEAGKRKIKIVIDLVLNHTSDKHPWFVESASSKNNPKRDWYIWRDGKNAGPPNNWQSLFGHSSWQLDPTTNQYYYHLFYVQQPDLNWRNPQVRKAMYDVVRFWLDRGVAGFRLDAVDALFEDHALTDNPPIADARPNAFGDPPIEFKFNQHRPEVHDIFRELRALLDSYAGNPVLIGETSADKVSQLAENYGKNHDEIQLPMNFFFAGINKLSANEFRNQIIAANEMSARDWPLYFFSNHDQTRHYIRYGNNKNNDQIAKLTATLLLTLRGSPILYYGEELGMENNDPQKLEDIKDPVGKIGWPENKGRDGERTPMQWTAGKNAGFSDVQPWLPVAGNYKTHNVQSEEKDANSILNFYRTLINLRRQNNALTAGKLLVINDNNADVLTYLRKTDDQTILVSINMSPAAQSLKPDLDSVGEKKKQLCPLLSSETPLPAQMSCEKLDLKPFSVLVAELK